MNRSAQFRRQTAIVDLLRTIPDVVAWRAIAEIPTEAQNDLYDFLQALAGPCEMCGVPLEEDDIELCQSCADRSDQLANLQELCNASGVVFGERV